MIEGDIQWPSHLLSEDAQLSLTVRGDANAFKRPQVVLLRNTKVIYQKGFRVQSDLPARIDFHLPCDLFENKGLYEVIILFLV